ncbi:galactose-specific lectin nattectin-like [Etheostoma cragini]|uniref:galactose-specific lectin nattectin-like n=1 Tax=Etheostoma cragini TaxID=417921 RepID=UPI00155E9DFB|nr:galactose-specific lectin nattectin-like [Etheostoma cragini]
MRPVVVTAILLLVVLMSTSDSEAEMCRTKYPVKPCEDTYYDKGWFQFGTSRCVKAFFNTPNLAFFDAERACKRIPNGNLVSIHSEVELNQVQCAMYKATTGKAHYWIGAFFTIRAGPVWVWSDDTKFDYNRWVSGQPSGNSQLCVEMNYWELGTFKPSPDHEDQQTLSRMRFLTLVTMFLSDWGLWNGVGCGERRPYVCAVTI